MKRLKKATLRDVRKLASSLAKKYKSKDTIIGLKGPLGAGKTAFVKSFAKALKVKKIKSPTFIIFSVYHYLNHHKLYHFDFYRLASQAQLRPLEFDDILSQPNRIILIEWVDKFPSIQKKCDLVIEFKIIDKGLRNVTIK